MHDVIIIGGGPAGLSAGIYGSRRGLKCLILEKGVMGGRMLLTTQIENYPGFDRISGSELAKRMEKQARSLGTDMDRGEIVGMGLRGSVKKITTGDREFESKAVVIANGGIDRKLGIPGEEKFTGRGVSYCATCDGPFFKGKKVAVVGGGNMAIEDASYLEGIAEKIYLIHRRSSLRAEESLQERVRRSSIELILNAEVEEISGENFVDSIKIKKSPEGEKTLEVDGVFIAIGIIPASNIAKVAGIDMDEKGFIKVNRKQETNIPGVYAAGDITGGVMQIVSAVSEGAIAALSAYEYIKHPYWAKK